jgi:hypothetical protein
MPLIFAIGSKPKTEVHMIPTAESEGFVARVWPELKDQLPDQSAFDDLLADNRVVLGPFAAYEDPPT